MLTRRARKTLKYEMCGSKSDFPVSGMEILSLTESNFKKGAGNEREKKGKKKASGELKKKEPEMKNVN